MDVIYSSSGVTIASLYITRGRSVGRLIAPTGALLYTCKLLSDDTIDPFSEGDTGAGRTGEGVTYKYEALTLTVEVTSGTKVSASFGGLRFAETVDTSSRTTVIKLRGLILCCLV